MEYFIGGLVFVLALWLFIWLADKALDGNKIAAVLVIIAMSAFFGYAMKMAKEDIDAGPCLRYEESFMMVNNVMTPYRYCVERGEWIK